MQDAVIVAAARTPIATVRKGTLLDASAFDLAKYAVAETLKRPSNDTLKCGAGSDRAARALRRLLVAVGRPVAMCPDRDTGRASSRDAGLLRHGRDVLRSSGRALPRRSEPAVSRRSAPLPSARAPRGRCARRRDHRAPHRSARHSARRRLPHDRSSGRPRAERVTPCVADLFAVSQ
jgi:hypothetical protein